MSVATEPSRQNSETLAENVKVESKLLYVGPEKGLKLREMHTRVSPRHSSCNTTRQATRQLSEPL